MDIVEKAKHWLGFGNEGCYYSIDTCSNTAQLIRDLIFDVERIKEINLSNMIRVKRETAEECARIAEFEEAPFRFSTEIAKAIREKFGLEI